MALRLVQPPKRVPVRVPASRSPGLRDAQVNSGFTSAHAHKMDFYGKDSGLAAGAGSRPSPLPTIQPKIAAVTNMTML